MTQSRVTNLHASLWYLLNWLLRQEGSKKRARDKGKGVRGREKKKENHRRREEKFRFLPGVSLSVVMDNKLEHESYAERQIAVCLCVYCVNLA